MTKCKICSTELTGKQRVYCSDKCKCTAYRLQAADDYRNQLHDKICELESCGNTFAGRKGKKYCSLECASKRRRVHGELTKRHKLLQYKKDTKSFYHRSKRYIKDYAAIDSGYF